MIFFASFLFTLRLYARKSEIKKILWWCSLECVDEHIFIKEITCYLSRFLRLFMPEIIFFKKELQIWDFESFIFWSKFRFFGTAFGRFSKRFFKNCSSSASHVADAFTHPSHDKKASYGPGMTTNFKGTSQIYMKCYRYGNEILQKTTKI